MGTNIDNTNIKYFISLSICPKNFTDSKFLIKKAIKDIKKGKEKDFTNGIYLLNNIAQFEQNKIAILLSESNNSYLNMGIEMLLNHQNLQKTFNNIILNNIKATEVLKYLYPKKILSDKENEKIINIFNKKKYQN